MKMTHHPRKCQVSLLLTVVFLWSSFSAAFPAQAQPQAQAENVHVYHEDYSSYDAKDFSENLEWDKWEQKLSLSAIDGIHQETAVTALDQDGNLAVVWVDPRGDSQRRIYAQKLDPDGNRLWQHDVQVNAAGTDVDYITDITVVVDADNHIVVVWSLPPSIYVQELGSNGEKLLEGPDDTAVISPNKLNVYFDLKADPAGGFVIAWTADLIGLHVRKFDAGWNPEWDDHQITPGGTQIPAMAIDHEGNVLVTWGECTDPNYCDDGLNTEINAVLFDGNGVLIWDSIKTIVTAIYWYPQAVAVDSQNNFVIAWSNCYPATGDASCSSHHIYAQKLNQQGISLWSTPGKQVSSRLSAVQPSVQIDSQDRVFFSWQTTSYMNCDVMVRGVGANGAFLWDEVEASMGSQCIDWRAASLVVSLEGNLWVSWTGADIFLQKVNAAGQVLWRNDVRVNETSGTSNQIQPAIAAAPGNQVYIAWIDDRRDSSAVYLQKYDQDGLPVWETDLLMSQDIQFSASSPSLAVDGDGNVTVAWAYNRSNDQIYLQRIDPNGNKLWQDEHSVGSFQGSPYDFKVVVDSLGQSIILWSFGNHLYAQKFNPTGDHLWPYPIHIEIGASLVIWDSAIAIDSQDNLYVSWNASMLDGTNYAVSLQKLSANGTFLWDQAVRLPSTTHILRSELVLDNQGNPVLVWSEAWESIHTQKFSPTGAELWADAVQVLSTGFVQMGGIAASDQGEITIPYNLYDRFVYARKIDASGQLVWPADVPVSSHSRPMVDESLAAAVDGAGNAWFVWKENGVVNGESSDSNIYFQKLPPDGPQPGRTWPEDMKVAGSEAFYHTEGTVQSRRINPEGERITIANLTSSYETYGGSIEFFLSNSGGADWHAIVPGVQFQFPVQGNDLRWKAVFKADPRWPRAPSVEDLEIVYVDLPPEADDYEIDDSCDHAQPIGVHGAAQEHTFHQEGDVDWVRFDPTQNRGYIIQTMDTGENGDTTLELFDACTGKPVLAENDPLSRDAQVTWNAFAEGTRYVRVSRSASDPGTDTVEYRLSIREFDYTPAVVLVVGQVADPQVQALLDLSGDRAYNTLLKGLPSKDRIRYFSPDPGRDVDRNGVADDISGVPTKSNLRDAIQDWAREQGVSIDIPFYLVLIGAGEEDAFLLEGEVLTPGELNLWLGNLEATSGTDSVNVVIEAPRSGSFIDVTLAGPDTITGWNRVVIASAGNLQDSFLSETGAFFTDAFFSGIGQNLDLKTAYLHASETLLSLGLPQTPQMSEHEASVSFDPQTFGPQSENTPAISIENAQLSAGRGLFVIGNSHPPEIDSVEAIKVSGGTVNFTARIRDDASLAQVNLMIFPPGFNIPGIPGGVPQLIAPITHSLAPLAGQTDRYGLVTAGFTEPGSYRFLWFAMDDQGNISTSTGSFMSGSSRLYLPGVIRQ